jgi:hypothetical protein
MAKTQFFGSFSVSSNRILALSIGLAFCILSPSLAWASGVTAQFSQVGDTLHLEFKGQNQWDYNLDKKQDAKGVYYTVEIPRLNEANVMELKKVQNPGLESLTIRHDGSDGRDVLILRLKSKDWEAFDYLTDQPSRLMIDFFQNQKKAQAEPATESVKPTVAAKPATVSAAQKKTKASLPLPTS